MHASLDAVPDAYREGEIARASLRDQPGVRALSSLSTLDDLVMRPDDSVRQLVRPQVRAFIEEDLAGDGVFADTLMRYAGADLNAKAAAASLHLQVNTVYYLLGRITEKTGYASARSTWSPAVRLLGDTPLPR